MTRDEADNSGDPFTAVFIAMVLGGDPLTAGLTTMFTGSTSLGVIAGIMAGDHDKSNTQSDQYQVGDGGASGGAGAGASFDSQSNQVVSDQQIQDSTQALPVIADPFSAQSTLQDTDSQSNAEGPVDDVAPSVAETSTAEAQSDDSGSEVQGTVY